MSRNVLTDEFSVHVAEQFAESFSETANSMYYMSASKTTPFDNDLNPPDPDKSLTGGFLSVYNGMIFAKNIKPNDISFMIRKVMWTEGHTYDMYDDKDTELHNKNYFVISQEPGNLYSVFKCIYNGKLVRDDSVYVPPVSDQPLSTETQPGDEYYRTSDGYIWKLMCVLTRTQFEKFSTDEYAPIIEDEDVVDSAKNGAIEHILVENPGSLYNSYAFGSIKQASVAGNNKIFSLQTDENNDILTFDCELSVGNFVEYHNSSAKKKIFFKNANGDVWVNTSNSPITATLYAQISTIVRVMLSSDRRFKTDIVTIYQTLDNTPDGIVSVQGEIKDVRRDLIPNLSSNTDFYKNSSFYIRNGRGAGQLRTITEYIVTGNERRVLIDTNFDILPDNTSRFEIGPRVIISGDGTGSTGIGEATAIVNMEESSNSIFSIEMVDTGKNYTYADVQIVSNTGLIDSNTNLSITANNADARPIISPIGGHGFNINTELLAKNIGISVKFDSFYDLKIPTQNDYRVISILKDPLFNKLTLVTDLNALLFNDGEIIEQEDGAVGEVFNRLGNAVTLTNIRGFFKSGSQITTKRVINNVVTTINSVDNTFDIVDQRTKFSVEVTNNGPQETGFILDEIVNQPETGSSGVVCSVSNNRIDLVEVKGTWAVSDDTSGFLAEMVGDTSGAVAKITGKVDSEFVKYSGKMMYIENMSPITRNESQSEQIKIVLNF